MGSTRYDINDEENYIPLVLDRLMSSRRITSTRVLSLCAALRGGGGTRWSPSFFPSPDGRGLYFSILHTNEPRHEKIGFLHMRKQRRRSAPLFSLYG